MRDLKLELREELEEILPASQYKKIDKIIAAFESYYDVAINGIEVIGGHVEVETVSYPGGRIGLDAAGNMVTAEFDYDCAITS